MDDTFFFATSIFTECQSIIFFFFFFFFFFFSAAFFFFAKGPFRLNIPLHYSNYSSKGGDVGVHHPLTQ